MYVILVYDVNVQRVGRVLKIARRYLSWVQNSVLEGSLTRAQFRKLKKEIAQAIQADEDSVLFYTLRSAKDLRRESLGQQRGMPDFFA